MSPNCNMHPCHHPIFLPQHGNAKATDLYNIIRKRHGKWNIPGQRRRFSRSFIVHLQAEPFSTAHMKTILLVVGRTVEPHFITAINDYVQRTRRYLSFDLEVIPELKNTKSLSTDVQKEKEADLILKALQPGDVVVLLDEGGKEMRSVEFADWMKRKMNTVGKRLVFVVGGPYGFSRRVYEAAQEKISLSRMTFSHQMVRLIFVEQLYRAMSILHGSPYHHE